MVTTIDHFCGLPQTLLSNPTRVSPAPPSLSHWCRGDRRSPALMQCSINAAGIQISLGVEPPVVTGSPVPETVISNQLGLAAPSCRPRRRPSASSAPTGAGRLQRGAVPRVARRNLHNFVLCGGGGAGIARESCSPGTGARGRPSVYVPLRPAVPRRSLTCSAVLWRTQLCSDEWFRTVWLVLCCTM